MNDLGGSKVIELFQQVFSSPSASSPLPCGFLKSQRSCFSLYDSFPALKYAMTWWHFTPFLTYRICNVLVALSFFLAIEYAAT